MKKSSTTFFSLSGKEDEGAISLKGALILIIVFLVIYGAISYIPAIQTPIDLNEEISQHSKDLLQRPGRFQAVAKKRFKPEILEILAKVLEGHTYSVDDLEIEFSKSNDEVEVTLPYTLKLHILGFEYNVDKELKVKERATRF